MREKNAHRNKQMHWSTKETSLCLQGFDCSDKLRLKLGRKVETVGLSVLWVRNVFRPEESWLTQTFFFYQLQWIIVKTAELLEAIYEGKFCFSSLVVFCVLLQLCH